jgi:tRNA A58 N-methylase Trm61
MEVANNCIYKYSEDNLVKEGDFVIIWDGPENKTQTIMKRNGKHQSKNGVYRHNDIIDKVCYGSKIF